ncbi:MAG TPA: hypothetical protein VHJ99_04770 [Candidatus Dormibacteraeota bacterium]|nr:hypothetical protein [Candidatus Dormibacteraeota bacterium]
MSKGWDDRAKQWLGWALTPNFDGYWAYRDAFFERVAPAPSGATLEVGCGGGRVAGRASELPEVADHVNGPDQPGSARVGPPKVERAAKLPPVLLKNV